MTLEKVTALLAEAQDVNEEEISRETTFESLGLDSLDLVDLVMSLEEEFGITLEMEEGLQSVGELVDIIDQLKAE